MRRQTDVAVMMNAGDVGESVSQNEAQQTVIT